MTLEIFLTMLLIVSSLAALVTEAVKTICKEYNKTYHANTLTGVCAFGVAVISVLLYGLYTEAKITPQLVATAIALVLLSWLCAMVGYDKVVQAISQFNKKKEE